MTDVAPPMAMLAELTHRCPLQCPYCSNPVALERVAGEMTTAEWLRAIREAAELGCMQVHFSGGEPTIRSDLEELVAGATEAGLYTNLITSGVLLDKRRVEALVSAGLEHVQLSFQDSEQAGADIIGNYRGGHEKKLEVAALVREAGLPLTANFVIQRRNCERLDAMLELAVTIGAHRVEIANVQYYGWALQNRTSLMPTRQQLDRMNGTIKEARDRLKGVLVIDYVVPDYYASRPKACMGGWARRFLNISPSGKVLPCHAAETIPDMQFDNVRQRPLGDIWRNSTAFNRFRGTDWMPDPCRSCDRREIDWGGCRCQALALTGDATRTDPACSLSPDHDDMLAIAAADAASLDDTFLYRRYRRPSKPANGSQTGLLTADRSATITQLSRNKI
jgi:pyrroloquinoline quinone biosynthesis protein E